MIYNPVNVPLYHKFKSEKEKDDELKVKSQSNSVMRFLMPDMEENGVGETKADFRTYMMPITIDKPGDYEFKRFQILDIRTHNSVYGQSVQRAVVDNIIKGINADIAEFTGSFDPVIVPATAYRLKITDAMGPALPVFGTTTGIDPVVWFLICQDEGKRYCGLYPATVKNDVVTPVPGMRPGRVDFISIVGSKFN